MEEKGKKKIIWGLITFYGVCLLFYRVMAVNLGYEANELYNTIWWVGIILLGSMMTGLLFEPMTKASFPTGNDPRIKKNPELELEDHEVMIGHYGFAALTAFVIAVLISPLIYGKQIILEVRSLDFIWAVVTTGVLNVGIFYFFIKAVRYGDISQISMFRGLIPILTLPISYAVYNFVESSGFVTSPHVTGFGFLGIILVVGALFINIIIKGSKKKPVEISALAKEDWFAQHPVVSIIVSVCFACFAINFDKVAVDSANPFIFCVVVLLIIAAITFAWVVRKKGYKRIKFLFRNYLSNFIKVGMVYGTMVVCMNVGLYGNNVNYVGAAKRVSIVFATIFGVFVLREGMKPMHKIVRVVSSILVFAGIFIMAVWG